MKSTLILLFFVLIYVIPSTQAQLKLQPELSATYMQHSKLLGISVGNQFIIPLKKGQLSIGGTFAYAEGNRNFDPSVEGLYTLQLPDYSPPFQPLLGDVYLFDHTIESEVKTSTTYQGIANVGYGGFLKDWYIEGGAYITYVNKSYLAAVIPDFDIVFFGDPWTIEYTVPFHIRYIDLGPYFKVARRIFPKSKIPIHAHASALLAMKNQNSYSLGLSIQL